MAEFLTYGTDNPFGKTYCSALFCSNEADGFNETDELLCEFHLAKEREKKMELEDLGNEIKK